MISVQNATAEYESFVKLMDVFNLYRIIVFLHTSLSKRLSC
jgi:hypothetical protein